jgi:hypothetical protein
MQRKQRPAAKRIASRAARRQQRIREDLESLGVSPAFAAPLAQRLEPVSHEIGTEAYVAALGGVAAAWDVCGRDSEAMGVHSRDVDEIRSLMHGFAGELRKLEEGLRIVSAYVLRMHRKATRDRTPLH